MNLIETWNIVSPILLFIIIYNTIIIQPCTCDNLYLSNVNITIFNDSNNICTDINNPCTLWSSIINNYNNDDTIYINNGIYYIDTSLSISTSDVINIEINGNSNFNTQDFKTKLRLNSKSILISHQNHKL